MNPPFSALAECEASTHRSLITQSAFLFRPLTRDEKGCDDGCVGAECGHPTCHHGFPSILRACEGCGYGFCRDHLTAVDTFRLCDACYASEAQGNGAQGDPGTALLRLNETPCPSLAEIAK